jgi:putative endonuclease
MEAHSSGVGSKFCAKYKVKHLLYIEEHPAMAQAIAREKQLKNWHRAWKWQLIADANPQFIDLITGETLGKGPPRDRGNAGDAEYALGAHSQVRHDGFIVFISA